MSNYYPYIASKSIYNQTSTITPLMIQLLNHID